MASKLPMYYNSNFIPSCSVADPDSFYVDPNPAFHFDSDPDPAFRFDTDPDPYRFKEVTYLKQYVTSNTSKLGFPCQ
jgi:hypothetical protein